MAPRRDWVPEFLAELERSGSVRASVRAVGLGRQTVYDRRDADPEFAAAWDAALAAARDRLAAAAAERKPDKKAKGSQRFQRFSRHRDEAPDDPAQPEEPDQKTRESTGLAEAPAPAVADPEKADDDADEQLRATGSYLTRRYGPDAWDPARAVASDRTPDNAPPAHNMRPDDIVDVTSNRRPPDPDRPGRQSKDPPPGWYGGDNIANRRF